MLKIYYTATCFIIISVVFVVHVSSEACIQCNSTTDPKCATDPNFLAKECNNSTSICYTRVLNGTTVRGCASELDNATLASCNNDFDCQLCPFNGCNRNTFPFYRAKCLQCTGDGNSSCALENLANPVVCPIYRMDEKCFIRWTGQKNNNSFMRGCLSSAQAENLCVDESNCFTCEGNGCNSLLSNSTDIPLARDSANVFATAMLPLLLAAALLASGAS